MARIRQLLKDKNFSLLWCSQIISNFGDRLNQMALIGLVYNRTPGSTIELAKLLSFTILPVFLIGPIAGIYVDRWNRKYIMVSCDLLRGVLVFFIPFIITHSKSMTPVYILVFIIFSITRFFLPSKMAIIPDIVHKDRLLLANSMTSTTMMVATIVGFGLGGILVAWLGPQGGFYVDAMTYFISAVMMSFVALKFKKKIDTVTAREKLEIIKKTILGDVKEGLAHLRGNKDIRMVANTMFLVMAGVGSIYIIIIVFVQQTLGSSTEHLGLLAMFLGTGLFLGSMGYGRFGANICKKKVINAGLSMTGFIIVIFAGTLYIWPSFFIASLVSVILGLFAAPIIVSSNTLLHEVMADEMRGRIFSSIEIIMHVGFLAFMILTSLVAERVGKASILITIGSIFSIIGAVKLLKGIKKKAV
ncbi:MAG: MFS transporter [Candidatus Omnitrophica bacterium]|nr:MFS transporter [Candidatus Omnitrophota bacterium]MBU4148773.1 MFS transporter [Candidatus Omnitrophota bacterium]